MDPPKKLARSLMEVCVVISMDEDTGLVPPQQQQRSRSASSNMSFEAKVVGVLSGQVASFPFCQADISGNKFYPPDGITSGKVAGGSSHQKLRRSLSRFNARNVELPVSSEVINTLIPLCLPDGGNVYTHKPAETFHSIVLTDIEGVRSYASVITLYKPFHVKEDESNPGHYKISPFKGESVSDQKSKINFIPLCCCLISKFPYFMVMKDCLSSLVPVLKLAEAAELRFGLMRFISQLAMVPVPSAGILKIEFELNGMKHFLEPQDTPERRVVDLELHVPFLSLSLEDVFFLLSCILVQQRIIFLSSNYSLLTIVIESLFTFIQPFSWSWTYVPILPSSLIDLIEAPGAFIMGCHACHQDKIVQVMNTEESGGLVVVNLDQRKISFSENIEIPKIPAPAQEKLKERLDQANLHYDLTVVGSPTFLTAEEQRRHREKFVKEFQKHILAGSLEMMVNMFSDIKDNIVQNETRVYFDRDAYIDSKPEEDRGFYSQVSNSHAFREFLYKIVENPNKRDYFDIMTERTERTQSISVRGRKRSAFTRHGSSNSLPVQETDGHPKTVFKLPVFIQEGLHTGRFYTKCIAALSEQINGRGKSSVSVGASLLYLRGMFQAANCCHFKALDDFQSLSSKSIQIFPTAIVTDIIKGMSEEEQRKLREKDYVKGSELWERLLRKMDTHNSSERTLLLSGIPEGPLDMMDFIKHVKVMQIAQSDEAATTLFQVLCSTGVKKRSSSSFYMNPVVVPSEFRIFYESLGQADAEAKAVVLHDITLDGNEFVVKASHLITTDLGMGRLILTTERLFFLAEGNHHCSVVARLLDIEEVQKYQHYIVLPPGVPALKIINKDHTRPPFGASLKEYRDVWFTFIKEMVAGYEIADGLKDEQVIRQAAQNVIVADALLKNEETEAQALKVCYLSTKRRGGRKKLGEVTSQALIRRVNPSDKDSDVTTVETLAYVPQGPQNDAQLWCGMASGSVVVIDVATWTIQTQLRCAKDRVTCMLAVGTHRVWAGSFDKTIYIIDTRTRVADQQLQGHTDYLTDMILSNEYHRSVWSASLNGQIFEWDTESFVRRRKIVLDGVATLVSLLLVGDNIWCATRHAVYVVHKDSEGKMPRFLSVPAEDSSTLSIDCLVKVSDDEVWSGCGRKGKIAVWNTRTLDHRLQDVGSTGFTKMVTVGPKVWAGGKTGVIYILDIADHRLEKELACHTDSVRSFCVTDCGHVVSGPGSRDGRIAVWRSRFYREDSPFEMGFEMVEPVVEKLSR